MDRFGSLKKRAVNAVEDTVSQQIEVDQPLVAKAALSTHRFKPQRFDVGEDVSTDKTGGTDDQKFHRAS
jgi:hypothetical protein